METLCSRIHFIIKTDQQSLKFLLERVTSTLQQKWVTKLLGLDYEIQYKQRAANMVFDALSRRGIIEGELGSITTLKPLWMQKIIESYEEDPLFATILAAKVLDPMSYLDYTITHILMYKGLVCVGQNIDIREKILDVMHSSSY